MTEISRRMFCERTLVTLGALISGNFVLCAQANQTDLDPAFLKLKETLSCSNRQTDFHLTPGTLLGRSYRKDAPFRENISPGESGQPVVVLGRILDIRKRQPLANATLEIWDADEHGHYDNDRGMPTTGTFRNRGRVRADEYGRYIFQCVHPGPYRNGPGWRAPHIHCRITDSDRQLLVTQIFFKGDPKNLQDQFIEPSLVVDFQDKYMGGKKVLVGTYDFVVSTD